jgi:hypothetical protein
MRPIGTLGRLKPPHTTQQEKKQMTPHRVQTETHSFCVSDAYANGASLGGFEVLYRPLNPKTGKPWQASRRVEHMADVTPPNWNRPIRYSTFDKALAAVEWQKARLAKHRRAA